MKQRKFKIIFGLMILAFTIILIPKSIFTIAGTQSNKIVFTSDIHGNTSNLSEWLSKLSLDGITDIDFFVSGGDNADTFQASIITEIKKSILSYCPKAESVFVMGNHEWRGSGSENAFTEAAGSTRTGVQVKNENYIIYSLGASSENQEFSKGDINSLNQYMVTVSTDVPVFVVSHFPLHTYSEHSNTRESANAKTLINVLNQYPNTIFMWGHNHTLKDEGYGTVKKPGDLIEYTEGKSSVINFTYANMGCMKDGASQDIYGLLASVDKNGRSFTVTLQYRSLVGSVGNVTTISSLENVKTYSNALLKQCKVTPVSKKLSLKKASKKTVTLKVQLPSAIRKVSTFTSSTITNGSVEGKISYHTGGKKVATVSKNGVVKAKKPGKTKIFIEITLANSYHKTLKTKIIVKR